MDRSALGWALLLSVPPGLGVTSFATRVTEQGPIAPLPVAVGFATTVVLFGFVLLVLGTGSPDPDRVA